MAYVNILSNIYDVVCFAAQERNLKKMQILFSLKSITLIIFMVVYGSNMLYTHGMNADIHINRQIMCFVLPLTAVKFIFH